MSKSIYIGYGIILNIGCIFGGVTLYLNDTLRKQMRDYKAENKLKEQLKKIHSGSAERYDKFYNKVEARNKINLYRKIMTSYTYGEILETGCGTGKNFVFYKPDQKILAIDYSQEMLDKANLKIISGKENEGEGSNTDITCKNITLANYDVEENILLLGENRFDCVVDFMNLQAYANPNKAIENISKVLKDKGKLIVICRGRSTNSAINLFYSVFLPTTLMRYGVNYTNDWEEFFSQYSNLKCLYKERKNWGKTYLFLFENNKV